MTVRKPSLFCKKALVTFLFDRFGCHVYVVSSLYCGVRQNNILDLCGTDSVCAIGLRSNEIVLLARLLITIPQIF